MVSFFFFFQAEDGIRDIGVTGVQTCALPIFSLVGGTMFLMWLGEQITSRGIGNGVSLIIMAGIVANFPTTIAQAFEGGQIGKGAGRGRGEISVGAGSLKKKK